MMVMDGAREQAMGEFRKKCREVGTQVRQMGLAWKVAISRMQEKCVST